MKQGMEKIIPFLEDIVQKNQMSEAHSREKSYRWKGGFTYSGDGYLLFKVPKGCKFSCMKDNQDYVKLHRLVMAEYLQRPLNPEEVVHHINGIKDDNRIENLRLLESNGKHNSLHKKGIESERNKKGQFTKINERGERV
ncbi:hypothetical protein ES705_47143 [subsurface metagenome]